VLGGARAQVAQDRLEPRTELDRPAPVALGRAASLAAGAPALAAGGDAQRAAVQVDVAPGEVERFRDPQPGGD
jgi:hypothetical protein